MHAVFAVSLAKPLSRIRSIWRATGELHGGCSVAYTLIPAAVAIAGAAVAVNTRPSPAVTAMFFASFLVLLLLEEVIG